MLGNEQQGQPSYDWPLLETESFILIWKCSSHVPLRAFLSQCQNFKKSAERVKLMCGRRTAKETHILIWSPKADLSKGKDSCFRQMLNVNWCAEWKVFEQWFVMIYCHVSVWVPNLGHPNSNPFAYMKTYWMTLRNQASWREGWDPREIKRYCIMLLNTSHSFQWGLFRRTFWWMCPMFISGEKANCHLEVPSQTRKCLGPCLAQF